MGMPMYIILINHTDQGIKDIGESPGHEEAWKENCCECARARAEAESECNRAVARGKKAGAPFDWFCGPSRSFYQPDS